jgi:hypothetical protein
MGVGILRNGAEGLDYGLLMAHHEHKLKQGEKSESSHRIHSSNMIHEQHLSSAAHLSAMNSVLKNSNTGKANGAHGKIVAAGTDPLKSNVRNLEDLNTTRMIVHAESFVYNASAIQ